MSKHDFVTWLNGWVELNGGKMPDAAQWKMITEHLALVFNKVTPPLMKANEIKLPNRYTLDIDNMPINDLSKVSPMYPGYYQPFKVGTGIDPGTLIC